MDLKNILSFIFFFFFALFSFAKPPVVTNSGVAFIHGTKDHRNDADGSYWKKDYIEEVSSGLLNPDNHFVVACDFDQYMWDENSAGCVSDQLLRFIEEKNITSLTVITHSDGANVIRWILSNPTYDHRYLELTHKIKEVLALAPSSAGTPLADEILSGGIFDDSLSWLLGYKSDAIRQQRVGDMLIYNQDLLMGTPGRPDTHVPFKVMVGTDVAASPLSSSSYCNGILLNSALKLSQLFLDDCSDGFLNCSSQASAGTIWFHDKDKTNDQLPISHNQSRHSCHGLGDILKDAIATQGATQ